MNKLIILILIVSFFITSCKPSKDVKNSFQQTEYCFDTKHNKFDAIVTQHGYFEMKMPYTYYGFKNSKVDSSIIINDTISRYCIFYNDGMFLYSFSKDFRYAYWGSYIIDGNIIKGQYIENPGQMSWHNVHVWFKIINNNSLLWLCQKYRNEISNQELNEVMQEGYNSGYLPAKFIHLDTLPNPDNIWLKNQKWFWCNEEDYYKWMKEFKSK